MLLKLGIPPRRGGALMRFLILATNPKRGTKLGRIALAVARRQAISVESIYLQVSVSSSLVS
jgi:hypothetical protein